MKNAFFMLLSPVIDNTLPAITLTVLFYLSQTVHSFEFLLDDCGFVYWFKLVCHAHTFRPFKCFHLFLLQSNT